MALIFDSLTTDRVLQSTGFSVQQAEGIAEQMNKLLIQDIATKGDLEAMRADLRREIGAVDADVKSLRIDMKAMASELTVKMYGVGFAVVALVVAAQKLLP